MKLIIAYIQPDKLAVVKESLFKAEVFKVSVLPNSQGCGQQKGYHESYRGVVIEVNFARRCAGGDRRQRRLRPADRRRDHSGARTGKIGDGKIFILHLEECIRIRTGETGGEAIG